MYVFLKVQVFMWVKLKGVTTEGTRMFAVIKYSIS